MAQSAMTVRLDAQTKKQFDKLCQQFGMSSNTAINIFVNQVVRDKSIPFVISAEDKSQEELRMKAIEAFRQARAAAESSSRPEMSIDEINAEIRSARREMRWSML